MTIQEIEKKSRNFILRYQRSNRMGSKKHDEITKEFLKFIEEVSKSILDYMYECDDEKMTMEFFEQVSKAVNKVKESISC